MTYLSCLYISWICWLDEIKNKNQTKFNIPNFLLFYPVWTKQVILNIIVFHIVRSIPIRLILLIDAYCHVFVHSDVGSYCVLQNEFLLCSIRRWFDGISFVDEKFWRWLTRICFSVFNENIAIFAFDVYY